MFLAAVVVAGIIIFPVTASATDPYYTAFTRTAPNEGWHKLGMVGIEIEPMVNNHRAFVEVEDGWDIAEINVTQAVYTKDAVQNNIPGDQFQIWDSKGEVFVDWNDPGLSNLWDETDPVDSFQIWLKDAADWDEVDIRIEFMNVAMDGTGDIFANFKHIGTVGQFLTGYALIGEGLGSDLVLEVVDSSTFDKEGAVTIQIEESMVGSWIADENEMLELQLPQHFVWKDIPNEADRVVFGDHDVDDFGFEYSADGRTLYVWAEDASNNIETRIQFTATIEVEDSILAPKGDIIADVEGDYEATPDELLVGVYGEYGVEVTASGVNTVYSGKSEQVIADITIEEEVGNSIIDGRIVTLDLPDWAAWVEGSMGNFEDEELQLNFEDLRADGRQARFAVVNDEGDPATVVLEDFEIMLSTEARGDVVVEVSGNAGATGNAVVAKAEAPVNLYGEDVPYVESDAFGQELAEIYLEEKEAGILAAGGNVVLELDNHVEWESGVTVEVLGDEVDEENDIDDVGDIVDIGDFQTNESTLIIPIESQSNVASTIVINGTATIGADATPGESKVSLLATSDAVVDDDVYEISENANYFAEESLFDPLPFIDNTVVAMIDVDRPTDEDGDTDGDDEDPDRKQEEPEERNNVEPLKQGVTLFIGQTMYWFNGQETGIDVAPFIENGITFVPMRFIAQHFDVTADWGPKDARTEWVLFRIPNASKGVEFTIGSKNVEVIDEFTFGVLEEIEMEAPAQIRQGRTMIPMRAVADLLNVQLEWGPQPGPVEWVNFQSLSPGPSPDDVNGDDVNGDDVNGE